LKPVKSHNFAASIRQRLLNIADSRPLPLQVVSSETIALLNERNEVDILRRRMDASVLLINSGRRLGRLQATSDQLNALSVVVRSSTVRSHPTRPLRAGKKEATPFSRGELRAFGSPARVYQRRTVSRRIRRQYRVGCLRTTQ
jgi:hypothetical protein